MGFKTYWAIPSRYYSQDKKGEVTFHQKFRNQKITWLHDVLRENKLNPLGITQKQWEELQMKNSEAIREKIQQIING